MGLSTDFLGKLFPFMLLFAFLEACLIFHRAGVYSWKEGLASMGTAIGFFYTGYLAAYMMIAVFTWLWAHRLSTVPTDTWWSLALLFLGVEFLYYWYHRCSHQIRWFWASHAVHHTPRHLNLSAAYRIGWTSEASGIFLFYAPLVWLGFQPSAVLTMLTVVLVYQFWLHTELVPKLGPLEKIFNTPSNHRVHHGINPSYINRNYGGVLILFDRMFGTYAEERATEPCEYGLVTQLGSYNPFVIAFHEWRSMLKDIVAAPCWRERLGYVFRKPGWRPDNAVSVSNKLPKGSRVVR